MIWVNRGIKKLYYTGFHRFSVFSNHNRNISGLPDRQKRAKSRFMLIDGEKTHIEAHRGTFSVKMTFYTNEAIRICGVWDAEDERKAYSFGQGEVKNE